jgi:segregation and condensation protein A
MTKKKMNFKLEKFEGPLSLLLGLVEREELDITEVSLVKITDQYIEYIKTLPNAGPEEIADFLVVASKLLLIKSRALLPFINPEEEIEIEEFENQLRMYKEFLEASKKVESLIGEKKFMFAREFNRQALLSAAQVFAPPKNISAVSLAAVFGEVLESIRPVQNNLTEEKLEHSVSIEEKILSIQKSLLEKIQISFNKIINDARNKTEMIVSFLAVLELMKQRELVAAQDNLFAEIFLSRC